MNENQAPRQNSQGDPCPPWCVTDHDEVHGDAGRFTAHQGSGGRIEVPGALTFTPDLIAVCANRDGEPGGGRARILLNCIRYGPGRGNAHLFIEPGDAEVLAAVLDMLDDWSQVRELVAAIRKAAASITSETGEKQ